MTFRYAALPGAAARPAAEIVVNVERAMAEGLRQAVRRPAWSPGHELALYVAHGCDHLTGADDNDPAARRRMRRRELRWLRAAAADGARLPTLLPAKGTA